MILKWDSRKKGIQTEKTAKKFYMIKYYDEGLIISKPFINIRLFVAAMSGRAEVKIYWERGYKQGKRKLFPSPVLLIAYKQKEGVENGKSERQEKE